MDGVASPPSWTSRVRGTHLFGLATALILKIALLVHPTAVAIAATAGQRRPIRRTSIIDIPEVYERYPRWYIRSMAEQSGQKAAPNVTALLRAWSAGDQKALDQLMPVLHGELKRIARRFMRGERQGHTLQPTALA